MITEEMIITELLPMRICVNLKICENLCARLCRLLPPGRKKSVAKYAKYVNVCEKNFPKAMVNSRKSANFAEVSPI
jgi:hypothetical protein